MSDDLKADIGDILMRAGATIDFNATVDAIIDRCLMASYAMGTAAGEKIDELQVENWALKQALGYPVPADREVVNNPFRCGTCDATNQRIKVLTSELAAAKMLVSGKVTDALAVLVEENERLYEALENAVEHDKIVAFHRREGGAQ